MACACNKNKNIKFVLIDRSGKETTFDTRREARAEQIKAGGRISSRRV